MNITEMPPKIRDSIWQPTSFSRKRMDCYFHSYDVIYAGKKPYDTSDMDLYEKKEIEVGYVKATDVVKSGTRCLP